MSTGLLGADAVLVDMSSGEHGQFTVRICC
jgi:hypothetical protein